jgi:hypothetical protein
MRTGTRLGEVAFFAGVDPLLATGSPSLRRQYRSFEYATPSCFENARNVRLEFFQGVNSSLIMTTRSWRSSGNHHGVTGPVRTEVREASEEELSHGHIHGAGGHHH